MIQLSAEDMEYLESHEWPTSVMDPKTFKHIKFIPDPERTTLLDTFFCQDSGFFVEMDNHGVNIHVFVYRETLTGPLIGFLYGSGSEETFYGDWFSARDVGPFLVSEKEVVKIEYSRADGKSFTT